MSVTQGEPVFSLLSIGKGNEKAQIQVDLMLERFLRYSDLTEAGAWLCPLPPSPQSSILIPCL